MLRVVWEGRMRVVLGNFLLLAGIAGLAGCASDSGFADLKKTMEDIRQQPRGAIQPPPEFKAPPTFTYAAHKLRSPFLPPSEDVQLPDSEVQVVAPDLTRPKEYLEQFNIEALKMVGIMARPGSTLEALVQDGAGGVQRVRVGNYLGRNFGRVVAIEESRISIAEIVPDGHDGWVERPRTIRLEGE